MDLNLISFNTNKLKISKKYMATFDVQVESPIAVKKTSGPVSSSNLDQGRIAIENSDGRLKIYGNIDGSIVNTDISNATSSQEGLMSAADKTNLDDVVANQLQTLRITFSDLDIITNEGSFTFTTGLPQQSTQYNSILSKGTYILECRKSNSGFIGDDSVSCIVSGKSGIFETSGVLYVQRGVLNYQNTAYNVTVTTNGTTNPGGAKIITSIVVSFSKVAKETIPVVAFTIKTLVNNYDKMSGDTEESEQEAWDTVKGKKQFIGNININRAQYGDSIISEVNNYSESILFCDENNNIIIGGYHTIYTGYSNNKKYVLTFQNSDENNTNVNLVITDTDYILGTIYVKFDIDSGATIIKGVFGPNKQNLSTSDFTKTWSGGVLKIAIDNKRYSLCASITFVQATYVGNMSIAPSKPLYANVLSDGSIEIRGDISNDYGACITVFKYAGTY